MLCKTAVATIMMSDVFSLVLKCNKHGNLRFHIPKVRSIKFLVVLKLELNRFSLDETGLGNGVRQNSVQG